MASSKGSKKHGGLYCVAGGPNQQSCMNTSYTEGVSMHIFPKNAAVRKQWVDFVRRHRAGFEAKTYSALCSQHFEKTCFVKRFSFSQLDKEGMKQKALLEKDAVPTIDIAAEPSASPVPQQSERERRHVLRSVLSSVPSTSKASEEEVAEMESQETRSMPSASLIDVSTTPEVQVTEALLHSPVKRARIEKLDCDKCPEMQLKVIALQKTCSRLRKRVRELKGQSDLGNVSAVAEHDHGESDSDDTMLSSDPLTSDLDPEWDMSERSDDNGNSGSSQEGQKDDDYEDIGFDFEASAEPCSATEPKFMVFYSKLLLLFSLFCFNCKSSKPSIRMKRNGTAVKVIQECVHCKSENFTWTSQPQILGKYPAGNVMLSFAVLVAGASISKILLVFKHMGMSAYSIRTYFRHQSQMLFPAILQHWKTYQTNLLEDWRGVKNMVWSGDARFDSMGHSAKYCSYTMLNCTKLKIGHFEILQSNETGGSSTNMELEGCKRSFTFLLTAGQTIRSFISDRHRGVAKWLAATHQSIKHFFDLWHVERSTAKKLFKASKESGCERIGKWIKSIRRHMYWCATTTKEGFGDLIVAKWKSIVRHIANHHEQHPDALFEECAHGPLEKRKWIKIGTKAHEKMEKILLKKSLLGDIKKLSPNEQTSCLEGFHSTLNQWHPKMLCFSWLGTYCRHILACLHFNENCQRKSQVRKDGKTYYHVTYPKYKLGEEIVREVPIPPSYEYVNGIKNTLLQMQKKDMEVLLAEYQKRCPGNLNQMFTERASKEDSIKKHLERKDRVVELHPPAQEQETMMKEKEAEDEAQQSVPKTRKAPTCRTCGQPMKGHPRGRCPTEQPQE